MDIFGEEVNDGEEICRTKFSDRHHGLVRKKSSQSGKDKKSHERIIKRGFMDRRLRIEGKPNYPKQQANYPCGLSRGDRMRREDNKQKQTNKDRVVDHFRARAARLASHSSAGFAVVNEACFHVWFVA